MGFKHLLPARRNLIFFLKKKRFLPDQTNGQKVAQGHVGLPCKLCLPQQPARMLRPAAHVDKQAVKHPLGSGFAQSKRISRAQNGALGSVRASRNMSGETRKTRQFRRKIVTGPLAPSREGRAPGRRPPERLSLIEMTCSPKTKAPRDQPAPIRITRPSGQISNSGQRFCRRNRLRQARLQSVQVRRFLRVYTGRKRRAQVRIGDVPCGDLLCIGASVLRNTNASNPRQARRGTGQILARLAKEGVHRDGCLQWKGGRHTARSRFGSTQDFAHAGRRNLTMVEEHLSALP